MATKKPTTSKPAKLETIKVNLQAKPVKKGDVVTVMVEGDYPSRYNEASSIAKQATQLMADLKPAMQPEALNHIFEHNHEKPWEPIASVALQDETGNVTRISNVSKYSETTPEVAEFLFSSIKKRDGSTPNVNDYMVQTVAAEFDSSVFQGPDGKFDKERYIRIMEALDKVCAELKVKNPLSSKTVVKPLPNFGTRRWVDFDKATNLKISSVIVNQVTFTPCPNALTGKMCGEEEEK